MSSELPPDSEIDKKIIDCVKDCIKKRGYDSIDPEYVSEALGLDLDIVVEHIRDLYNTQKIVPSLMIEECDCCCFCLCYSEDDTTKEFMECILLNRRIETDYPVHIPEDCPLRTKKYYFELVIK